MIPLRDTIPSRTVPVVNVALILANVFVFLLQLASGPVFERVIFSFGLVPARLFNPGLYEGWTAADGLLTLVTAMFLHGGFLHLAGNMLYLWIFGDNVEDALGHVRYLVFYLGSGVLAGLTQAALFPGSQIPMVGASGAIAGVLGAYLFLYPRARVVTLVPLFFLFPIVEIPAGLYILIWFLMQFLMGTSSLSGAGAESGGVAWWAHVGGFVAGLCLLLLLRPRKRRPAVSYRIR